MSNWQRRLKLQPEWDLAQNGRIAIQEMAQIVADRLKALEPFVGERLVELERMGLIEAFDDLTTDEDAIADHFDSLMDELYEWGDTSLDGRFGGKKVCWIDTIGGAS